MCQKPFPDIESMNETMIENWNERVRGNDTVLIVGDLFFHSEDPERILRRLKGRKRLVVGNHDSSWMGRVEISKYFVSVDNFLEITDGSRILTLCHYPLLTWKHEMRANSFMIHGHIHANTEEDFWSLIRSRDRVLNAGVEINGYKPVTFEELLENNRRFKEGH